MTPYTKEVIRIITSIPAGKIMTYGQIAKLAGSPRSARQVVRILHSMSDKYNLPWHRVINSKGEIGIPDEEGSVMQRLMLLSEGVEVSEKGLINLEKFQYNTYDYIDMGGKDN
jgi:methylated-DNA-protein-cysteine methyltransferase related protein